MKVKISRGKFKGINACADRCGVIAASLQEAIEHFRKVASATTIPFIFLSDGITNEVYCEMLELTAESGVKFSGVQRSCDLA
jgi:tagatose-1,6-bisphosphate aldolase